METNRAVIDKIKYLYKRLYKAELFSSSLAFCMNERDDFYEYSRQQYNTLIRYLTRSGKKCTIICSI